MKPIDKLLAAYAERLEEDAPVKNINVEKALYHLLLGCKDDLPKLDNYFHKAFRQCDVIDFGEGSIDAAIYVLLSESELFWKFFVKFSENE